MGSSVGVYWVESDSPGIANHIRRLLFGSCVSSSAPRGSLRRTEVAAPELDWGDLQLASDLAARFGPAGCLPPAASMMMAKVFAVATLSPSILQPQQQPVLQATSSVDFKTEPAPSVLATAAGSGSQTMSPAMSVIGACESKRYARRAMFFAQSIRNEIAKLVENAISEAKANLGLDERAIPTPTAHAEVRKAAGAVVAIAMPGHIDGPCVSLVVMTPPAVLTQFIQSLGAHPSAVGVQEAVRSVSGSIPFSVFQAYSAQLARAGVIGPHSGGSLAAARGSSGSRPSLPPWYEVSLSDNVARRLRKVGVLVRSGSASTPRPGHAAEFDPANVETAAAIARGEDEQMLLRDGIDEYLDKLNLPTSSVLGLQENARMALAEKARGIAEAMTASLSGTLCISLAGLWGPEDVVDGKAGSDSASAASGAGAAAAAAGTASGVVVGGTASSKTDWYRATAGSTSPQRPLGTGSASERMEALACCIVRAVADSVAAILSLRKAQMS